MMKPVALFLLFGFSLGGCYTPTPGEKAYSACLASVPEDIARAAEGEIDMYQERTPTALVKSTPDTSTGSIASHLRCSPDCHAAREEQHRIASECYQQWQRIHPSLVSDTEVAPGNLK